MKRYELVQMVDPNEFRRILAKAKLSNEEKASIIHDRSQWLWETYKPADEEIEYWRERIKRKDAYNKC